MQIFQEAIITNKQTLGPIVKERSSWTHLWRSNSMKSTSAGHSSASVPGYLLETPPRGYSARQQKRQMQNLVYQSVLRVNKGGKNSKGGGKPWAPPQANAAPYLKPEFTSPNYQGFKPWQQGKGGKDGKNGGKAGGKGGGKQWTQGK